MVLSVALGWHRRSDLSLGPIDEQAHYDYVVELSRGRVPAYGDKYTQTTLRVISCLGVFGTEEGSCAIAYRNPVSYVPRGYSYQAQQAPLAYLPYLATARPDAPPRSALAAAREGGPIWVCLSAGLLVVVGGIEGLDLLALTTLLSICLLSPVAVYSWSTVTNDSAGVAAGALAVITSSIVRQRGSNVAWISFGVGMVIGLLKGLFFIAPLALLISGLLRETPNRTGVSWARLWARHKGNVLMLAGAMLSLVGWAVLQDLRGSASLTTVLDAGLPTSVRYFHWSALFGTFKNQFTMLVPYYYSAPWYWVWNVAVFGTFLAPILVRGRSRSPALAASAIGVVAALAIVSFGYPAALYFMRIYSSGISARLGLPVLPIVALIIVRYARRPWLIAVGVALPAIAAVSQLASGKY